MQSSLVGGLKFLLIVPVLAFVLQPTSLVSAVVIGDCSGKDADAKLIYVDVQNCGEKDLYCPFIRGTNASMEVAFKTNAPFKQAKVDIVGTFARISRHFDIKPDNACGNYGFDCPVRVGEEKKLKLTLPVKKIYPSGLLVQVTFKLLDENKNNIFCITFPAKITTR